MMEQHSDKLNAQTQIARRYIQFNGDVRLAKEGNSHHLALTESASLKSVARVETHAPLMISMRMPLTDMECEGLLNSLLDEQRIMPLIKHHLVSLRILMRRAYMNDESILGMGQQAVRQFIQILIQLSDQSAWLTQEQHYIIQQQLDELIAKFDTNVLMIQEVTINLAHLFIQRHHIYEKNKARLILICNNEERLKIAQQTISFYLKKLFHNQPIPNIIFCLFKQGWMNLLLTTYYQQGIDSVVGRRGLNIVNHLMAHYLKKLPDERSTPAFHQKIIEAIQENIAQFSQNNKTDFFENLTEFLLSDVENKTCDWNSFSNEFMPWYVFDNPVDVNTLEEKLPLGAWVGYDALIQKKGPFQLVWVSSDKQYWVFANRLGIKILEKTAAELKDDLDKKRLRILTEKNCSTVDPGLDELIRAAYFVGEETSDLPVKVSSMMEDCVLRVQPLVRTADIPLDWQGQIKAKVDLNQIFPAYHYEILLGLRNKEGEILSPFEFIQAAEHDQHIRQVDRWVISHAFDWLAQHQEIWQQPFKFSINLSGQSLNDITLLEFIFSEFKRTGIPHQMIGFEITETSAVASMENAEDFIQEMKRIGCHFSLDDFGTGLSSYGYLKSLSVDVLKIDGIFVKNLAINPADHAMVKSITEMGHAVQKKVVAEFVDTAPALEKLIEIGVDYIQGHFVGMPRLLDDLSFPAFIS